MNERRGFLSALIAGLAGLVIPRRRAEPVPPLTDAEIVELRSCLATVKEGLRQIERFTVTYQTIADEEARRLCENSRHLDGVNAYVKKLHDELWTALRRSEK